MDRAKAEILISSLANFNGVDPLLACAIAEVESSFSELAVRFEASWKYLYQPEAYGKKNGITEDTERILQMCSWGMMQVMGSVARELHYSGPLIELSRPELGVRFGCLKIKELMLKYSKQSDVIAAYNAGMPRHLTNGRYFNQGYVDKVEAAYARRKTGAPGGRS